MSSKGSPLRREPKHIFDLWDKRTGGGAGAKGDDRGDVEWSGERRRIVEMG